MALTVVQERVTEEPSENSVSLAYIDDAPTGEMKRRIDVLLASTMREMGPYQPPLHDEPTASTRAPALTQRSTLAIGVTATGARGQLGIRFGAAAWKEQCERAEKALIAIQREMTQRKLVLDGINKRRAKEQRACEARVSKLRRRYWAVLKENRDVSDALHRMRS